MKIHSFITIIVLLILATCLGYTDSIPNNAFINLRNQSSFRFRYQFKSDTPHNVIGIFKGLIVFPNQEERQGVLERNSKKITFKTKARANYQHNMNKQTSKWQVTPRDENSLILVTVERTLTNAKFNLVNEDNKFYTYRFIPNLVFLDPTFTRKISALLVIDKKNHLPKKIIAQDSLKKIYWQVEFFDFNHKKRIKFPFLPNTKIRLASKAKLTKNEINSIKEIITKRLEAVGENFRINSKTEKNRTVFDVSLEILEPNPDYELLKQLLVSAGHLTIYPYRESIPLLNTSNISDIKIISYEPYPQIELQLNQHSIDKMKEYLGVTENKTNFRVLLDSTELAIFDIDKSDFSDRIILRVLTNKNEIMNTIAILKGGILQYPLEIIDIWSGR